MNYFSIPGISDRPVHPESIDEAVCEVWETTMPEIMQPTRKREVSEPRQVNMALRLLLCKHTREATGKLFMKDHATAQHAISAVLRYYQSDPLYRRKLFAVLQKLEVKSTIFQDEIKRRKEKS